MSTAPEFAQIGLGETEAEERKVQCRLAKNSPWMAGTRSNLKQKSSEFFRQQFLEVVHIYLVGSVLWFFRAARNGLTWVVSAFS
jgi:hypothetical protein